MTRYVSDILRTLRLAIARRNENDPDSSDETLMQYINDFYTLTMSDDVKLFEQFGTLTFNIDENNTSGVYQFPDAALGNSFEFINISSEALISLTDPVNNSVSWNQLYVFQDPGQFFYYWGINNDEVLIPGFPTQMLYYGNEFTFRTIPNTLYTVKIYGYKKNLDFPPFNPDLPENIGNPELKFEYWMRYLAYGAALNYARDYKFSPESRNQIQTDFNHERKQLLTRTHNQIKISRAYPRF